MPKELIYNPHILDGAVPDYEVVEHLAVGWSPERDVQIGVTFAQAGAIVDGSKEPIPSAWMDIDRAGINRLIHSLRKARDAAYGKDA